MAGNMTQNKKLMPLSKVLGRQERREDRWKKETEREKWIERTERIERMEKTERTESSDQGYR
jgi:hypothetical protein